MKYQTFIIITCLTIVLIPALRHAQAAERKTVTNSIGMKLVHIPAGTFKMGSPRGEAERDDKELLHEVKISTSFYLGAYEVTQAEYVGVMKDLPKFRNRAAFKGDDNPAENIEWKLAKQFCKQLTARAAEKSAGRTYRLPTEAEWEYACRGGKSTVFHAGDSLSSKQANFNGGYPYGDGEKGQYLRKTVKGGSYQPNAFGLYDMHGNVAEWCADWYDPKYYQDSPQEDPLGPPFGVIDTRFTNFDKNNFFVVVRAGSWVDDGRACRAAYRFRAMPNTQYRLIGFRVVCEVKGE
ncbi:MAG: formylglycine-generating enzyme family protein [Planctomycetes bacterium]|nr:formylglycine-generating enzyme family protein [Planctomycetota bacterium]